MIIHSLLDTDLYKFTMMQVVLHHFPGARVEYRFKCRNPGIDLAQFAGQIREEVRHLCSLQFHGRRAELPALDALHQERLRRLPRPVPAQREVHQHHAAAPRASSRSRIKGPWLHTILFEIPVLAIVNEVYFRNTQPQPGPRRRAGAGSRPRSRSCRTTGWPDLKIADYGTRRRFSKDWHEEVLRTLAAELGAVTAPPQHRRASSPQFAGTSNVLYAMKLGLIPLGTMAHEYLQACQALGPRLRDSQVFGFEIVGPRVPRRPRHRAVGRLRHERLPARLRPVLLQAVRRRAPRQRRSVPVGRAHDGALHREPRRSAHQDADLQRQPHGAARPSSSTSSSAAAASWPSASAPTSPTTSATSRCRS